METFSGLLALCAGNSPVTVEFHKGQWRVALRFSLICAWIKYCVNNREAGDLRRYRLHYDVIVMATALTIELINSSCSSAAYMRRWTRSSLVQIIACRLFGAKPLTKPMLVYCQLEPYEKLQRNFNQYTELFIHETSTENIVCEMAAILFRGRWDKRYDVLFVYSVWCQVIHRQTIEREHS